MSHSTHGHLAPRTNGRPVEARLPLVSVIIPSRNRPHLLPVAVRSALEQTYSLIEVVVADDASDPPVRLPDSQNRDGRVRVIRLPARAGPGDARNVAVSHSSGPLIAFLDDDDEWEYDKLARQVELLTSSGDGVAAVESGCELHDRGRPLLRYLPRTDRDLRLTLLELPCMQPSTVLIRRRVFEELGGFDGTLARTEDWELWVRLSERYDVAVIPEIQVRRALNREPPAAECLDGYRQTTRRLEARIERRSRGDRARIRSAHALAEGTLLVQAGQCKVARRLFVRAWRLQPHDLRPLLHLGRTYTGERAWQAAQRARMTLRKPLARVARRDPLLREW